MAKGGEFERKMSKELSLYITNGKDPDAVWHTKGSGGRATKRKKLNQVNKKYEHGDLGPDDPKVNYFFDFFNGELKTGYAKTNKSKITNITRVNQWCVLDLLDSPRQQIPMFYDFWNQILVDSEASGREPLLIFRRLRKEPCIAMHLDIFDKISENILNKEVSFDILTVKLAEYPYLIAICNMREFYKWSMGIMTENFIKRKLKQVIERRL